jgi:hypothetical protein
MKALVFASSLALIASAGLAQANTITGSIWENDPTGAGNATPANVPLTTPNVTFSVVGPLDFQSGPLYTIGEFLASGPNPSTVFTGAGQLGNTLDNTIFDFQGQVTVTNGQTFTAGHDDGLTLTIGGVTVISAPGGTSFVNTTETYTGPSGTFAFNLVYGECCGAPAALAIDLPLIGGSVQGQTPIPAALPLFATGLGLFGGAAGWRRRRKAALAS